MLDAAMADTLPPPADLPHQCRCCGAVYTPAEWDALTTRRSWVIAPGDIVELAECVGTYRDGAQCANTLSKQVARSESPTAEHRRDEGDDVLAEERAERESAWRERGW